LWQGRTTVKQTNCHGEIMDQEFVEYIVKAIVDHPEDVKTERKVDEMGVLIILKVNSEDIGKVIGKKGQTINSIRTVLRVLGMKNKARVNLKLEEPESSKPEKPAPITE